MIHVIVYYISPLNTNMSLTQTQRSHPSAAYTAHSYQIYPPLFFLSVWLHVIFPFSTTRHWITGRNEPDVISFTDEMFQNICRCARFYQICHDNVKICYWFSKKLAFFRVEFPQSTLFPWQYSNTVLNMTLMHFLMEVGQMDWPYHMIKKI